MCDLILKCTRNCNFACNYCVERRKDSDTLDFEILIKLVKGVLSTHRNIRFIYHGGEPLLLGQEYFSKILVLQNLCKSSEHHIANLIQTNGSLIDDDWCGFFKKNGFQLGISLDGPKPLHDANRRYSDGKPTFSDVTEKIPRILDSGLDFGGLSVVTENMLKLNAEEIFRFFVDIGINYFAFLPERPKNTSFGNIDEAESFYLLRRKYAEFLCNIYRCWMRENDPTIQIREISNKLHVLLGGQSHLCTEGGSCVGMFFGIDSSGEVAHCDKFFQDPGFQFGNLRDESFPDILKSEVMKKAINLEKKTRRRCKSCTWFSFCGGGCLDEALLFYNSGLEDRTSHCHRKIVWDFMYKDLSRYSLPDACICVGRELDSDGDLHN